MNIDIIELYFQTFGYANEDIETLPGHFILVENSEYFVTSSLKCLRAHSGNKRFMPYYDELVLYYNKVKTSRL